VSTLDALVACAALGVGGLVLGALNDLWRGGDGFPW
jgi:hypothetical protein